MAKQRQTQVNIDYKVNTVDVERGNELLVRASKSTDELRRATDNYAKQAGAGYKFTSKTIEGMSIEVARLKQQVKLASTSADSVKGQFLREWEEHLVILADGNPVMEKELRKMDHFSFLNRILALNKKAKAEESAQVRAENSFGRKL